MKNIFLLFVILFFVGSVSAQTIEELVIFGDSLSDNGNLYSATRNYIPKSPPYYFGRFSNGPVWAEILGDVYKNKYNIKTTNYAVGGATTIRGRVRDGSLPYYLKKEIDKYLSKTNFPQRSKTLYVMWIGANDYMTEKKQSPHAAVTEVINEITSQIKTLITSGGKQFVLIDMPDFSKTPYALYLDQTEKDRLHIVSELNHKKMLETINRLKLEYPNFKFIFIDAYNMFNDIIVNIDFYNRKYGSHITNTKNSCWSGGYSLTDDNIQMIQYESQSEDVKDHVLNSTDLLETYRVIKSQSLGSTPCANPDDYIFWDSLHPTSAAHVLLMKIIAEKLESEYFN